ncbi:hypothetical protein FN846DRAFT_973610 [Sphaerosporella brunnea]|uniref:Uncharacterized protein n=1 Tax=Sphaerosporella brunnea TaxID=1250544 RepID=A0A5J5EHE0_9PEZI|nr:hypothetical protein FN846DRAFT_973610 [Sphaerosporella brunnea]
MYFPAILRVFTLLSLLLLGLLTVAAASPARQKPHKPRTFRLRADQRAPAPVNKFGFLDYRLGWYASPAQNYHAYIEPYGNRTTPGQEGWGKCHDASNPAAILWLRPTHGTPMYFVFSGDPNSDTIPALTLWDSWAISRGPDGREFLNYGQSAGWMACKSGNDWRLYWGPQVGPPTCTNVFALEVVWDYN